MKAPAPSHPPFKSEAEDPTAGKLDAAAPAALLYVAWSNNCRGSGDHQLYIGHGVIAGARTLCGVAIQECGDRITPDLIGCKRCARVWTSKSAAAKKRRATPPAPVKSASIENPLS